MNNIIYNQLKQVTSTSLNVNKEDKEVFIPKTIKIVGAALKKGKVYIVELNDIVTHPSENSTLASNWNSGIIPKYNKYIVEITNNMANMIQVNGVAVEDNTS